MINLLVSGLILIGLFGFAIDPEAVEVGALNRFSGFFANPNGLGMVAMLGFFISIATQSTKQVRNCRFGFLTLIIDLVAIILSGSRASLIGLLAGLIIYMMFTRENNKTRTSSIITVSVLLVLFGALVFIPDVLLTNFGRLGDSGRIDIWQNYIAFGMKSPLWGQGFSASPEAYNSFIRSIGQPLTLGAHNSYLQMFMGLGIVGLMITFWGFFRIFAHGFRVIRHLKANTFLVSLYAAVIAGLINAVFEAWLFSFGNGTTVIFWLVVTILCIYVQHPPTSLIIPNSRTAG